ncbi:MAG: hypothetical protein LUH58_05255 [Lachnospiraceae bacterium]|nr:hypothetical protein [Lachnospiraceae bacterium]
MAIFTQLEALDFTGKNVFAVMTHEGSCLGKGKFEVKQDFRSGGMQDAARFTISLRW